MALGPGAIAFIAFNADGNDGFAFIVLDTIPAGTIIRFVDNEWNGSPIGGGGAFNTGEGGLTWTNGATDLAPGTIVEFLNTSAASGRTVNFGTMSAGNLALGNSDEAIYAFIGSSETTPDTFLAAITNGAAGFTTAAVGSLAGTGLTAGTHAIVLPGTTGADVAAYNPSTGGVSFATLAAALAALNNPANWVAQDASGAQDADGVTPDAPFLTDSESPLAGVSFSIGATLPTLTINDPTVAEGNSGTTVLTYTVTSSAPAPAGGITFDIATADGTALTGSDYVAKSLTGQTIAAGSSTYAFTVTVNGDTAVETNETVLVNLANVTGATVADGQGSGTITNDDVAPPAVTPWINEIHYDNQGSDTGEFIEIAGAAGTDLTGYSLVLYNGNGGAVYNTKALSGVIADQQGGFGTLSFVYPTDGIQNGSPDGMALVKPDGTVVQFLSYEGVFTAVGGAANGMLSTDIGVTEAGASTLKSLQLGGVGTKSSDFTWQPELNQTVGAVNDGQTFGTPVPTVSIANASISEGDSGTKLLTFTVTRSDVTTAFSVNYGTADGTATMGSDYETAGGTLTFTAGGPATQDVSVTIKGDTANEANETFTVTLSGIANTAGATAISKGVATGTILNDDVSLTRIYQIQGSGHASAFAGQTVTTQGVVTGIDGNGFFIQDLTGDGDASTSDGVFVFTNSAPPATVVVGALLNVTGLVEEYTPSGAAPGYRSTTEITAPTIVQVSTGQALPTAVTLAPPTADLAAAANYFESLEGMLVKVAAPLVTGPTNNFGEIWTVANKGAGATGLNGRGDILVTGGGDSFGNTDTAGGDFNPERIQIDPGLGVATPNVSVGATLGDVTGIMHYSFANYEVLATTPVTIATPSPLVKTGATLTGDATHLLVASYNAENLDPNDGAGRFATIGAEVVGKLNAPDIIALQEIQDNNGAAGGTGSAVTSASQTLQMLVDAINAAGGPQYAYVDNTFIGANTNGGEPGGNIRTAFLYRTDRVSLVSGSARSIGANGQAITAGADPAQQSDPNHPFYGSRPPLAADFVFNGDTVTVVNNHFTSKGGSGALLGSVQPPFDAGEVQRAAQAQAVNNFVDALLSAKSDAKIIVTGDLNDFDFEQPLSVLKGEASISGYAANGDPINATATYTPGGAAVLTDLQDLLPADQRFDYVFEGNAETLDHMLVSSSLAGAAQFQPVHINAEFWDQTSDHDPLVGRFAVTGGLTTQQVVSGAASFTLATTKTLTVANGPAVLWDLAPATTGSNATVDNAGVITATAGRGLDTKGSSNGDNRLTVLNKAGATITSVDDAIRVNADLPNGKVTIDNSGTIQSTGINGAGGQALDLNKLASGSVTTVITNRATGVISAAGADAIRPGANAVIDNYGKISGGGSDGNDGVDFQDAGYGVITNYTGATIEGTRHGITGKLAITVNTQTGSTITGQLGSGINLDTGSGTTALVTNKGTITGNANGANDGDGIDVDGLLTLNNYGLVQGLGTWSGGLSEGLTIGGGAVNNYAGAKIYGAQRAITVDDSNLGPAFAVTTIYNEGTIEGGAGEAISLTGDKADTVTNKGAIVGSVRLGGGADQFVTYVGATSGAIDAGDGVDVLALRGTGKGSISAFSNFETVEVYEGEWTVSAESFAKLDLKAGAQTVHLGTATLADGKFAASIAGFGADDTLRLDGVSGATKATLGAGNMLTVTLSGGGNVQLQLDPGASYAGQAFKVASDGAGGTAVTMGINQAPVFTTAAAISTPENTLLAATVKATDANSDPVSYAITGGADKALFSLNAATGALSWITSPDYETRADADGNGVYDVAVTASDGVGGQTNQTLAVTVTNVSEPARLLFGDLFRNDTLTGGTGDDYMVMGLLGGTALGGDGDDMILGGVGADQIFGGRGNDNLLGSLGNDILVGEAGNDALSGGFGDDDFRLSAPTLAANGSDRITDFSLNNDQIGLLKGASGWNPTTAAGRTLAAADFSSRNGVANIIVGDTNKVVELQNAHSTSQMTTGVGAAANAYVAVYNSSVGAVQIWYDDNWSNTAGRTLLAELVGVKSIGGAFGADEFSIYQ